MFITVITDCKSENDKARQQTRYSQVFGIQPALIGVDPAFDSQAGSYEAGGTLIDVLDASDGKPGVIVVNVAPRGNLNEGPNGTPFCFFWWNNKLVITSVNEIILGFIKKFGLVSNVSVVSVHDVLNECSEILGFDSKRVARVQNTQFRSFEFVPYLAHLLWVKKQVPSETYSLDQISPLKRTIWYIDDFGNSKTTYFLEELSQTSPYQKFNRLKDIPKGQTGLYEGSSGLGDKRFIELATQQGNVSAKSFFVGQVLHL